MALSMQCIAWHKLDIPSMHLTDQIRLRSCRSEQLSVCAHHHTAFQKLSDLTGIQVQVWDARSFRCFAELPMTLTPQQPRLDGRAHSITSTVDTSY